MRPQSEVFRRVFLATTWSIDPDRIALVLTTHHLSFRQSDVLASHRPVIVFFFLRSSCGCGLLQRLRLSIKMFIIAASCGLLFFILPGVLLESIGFSSSPADTADIALHRIPDSLYTQTHLLGRVRCHVCVLYLCVVAQLCVWCCVLALSVA